MEQQGFRIHEWGGPLRWETLPVPQPGDGEVLVEVEACGIGSTVLNGIDGRTTDDPALLPRVPGHELAGRVAATGPGADPALAGRRVAAYFYLSCGTCPACLGGEYPRCAAMAGWVGIHRDGGYAPWAVLPARNVLALPPGLDPVAATIVPDAVATPVHVCATRARVGPSDRVAVVGAGGGVGAHMAQVARLHGAAVAGLDVVDDKLGVLDDLGIMPVRSDDLAGLDAALWPTGGPTVVIDLVGSEASLGWACRALEPGGRLVLLTADRRRTLPAVLRDLVFRELTVLGSRYATPREVLDAAALVATGRVRPVIGARVDPAGVEGVHQRLRAGTLVGRGALVWRDGSSASPAGGGSAAG